MNTPDTYTELLRKITQLEHENIELKKQLIISSGNNDNFSVIDTQKSESFRKAVFESSIIGVVIMDTKTYKYLDCNDFAVKLYGYTQKSEILGKHPIDFSAEMQYDGSYSSEKALH